MKNLVAPALAAAILILGSTAAFAGEMKIKPVLPKDKKMTIMPVLPKK